MTLDDLIVAFLPARRDRQRVTIPTVIAVNLGYPVADVAAAMARLEASGRIVRDKSGWHRGLQPGETRCR